MNVRCKFMCNEITMRPHWDKSGRYLYSAKLSVVSDGSPENKEFFAATPSGTLEIGVFQTDAFTPGKQYYVDLTEA